MSAPKLSANAVFSRTKSVSTNQNFVNYLGQPHKLSFEKLGLIGKTIYLIYKPDITAEVIGNKELQFEDKKYKLSPLTRLCMERLGEANKSGAYRGVDKWGYQGKALYKLMQELPDDIDNEDDELSDE